MNMQSIETQWKLILWVGGKDYACTIMTEESLRACADRWPGSLKFEDGKLYEKIS